MITVSVDTNHGIRVVQRDVSPSVYLDHWAWCETSGSQVLASRFASALRSRNGTLAVSWMNLVEFGRMTDQQQAGRADDMLDAILPHVFFLEPDFFKVIDREDKLLAGGSPSPPHSDLGLLEYSVKSGFCEPASSKVFSANGLHQQAQATGIGPKYAAFADVAIGHVENLRGEFEHDQWFRSRVKGRPSVLPLQRGTRFIRNELLRAFLVDKGLKATRNNVIDVCHAIVPVAYCDYVLLDKLWEEQVNRARVRLVSERATFPLAKVFSRRAEGIERFLGELQSS